MNRYVYTFESLSDFLAVADIPRPDNAANYCAWEKNTDWHGVPRTQAVTMARMGWPEGRSNMVEAMAQARPSVALPPAFTMDVGGAYPIAAIAAAGDPCSMVCPDPVETAAKPIVRLAVNVWASCAYEDSEFTAYGAAVMSYIDAIESSGARVELTCMCHCATNKGNGTYTCNVILKRAEDPIDIDRVTFCMTHVSMLRRIFFAHMQVAEGCAGLMTYCGTPRNPDERDAEPGQIIIPGINTISPGSKHLKTPKACAEHISSTMQTILTSSGVSLPELAFGKGTE